MMKLKNLFFITVLASTMFTSCKKDDPETSKVPDRDRGEQAIADDEALISFMKTHFYNYEEFEAPTADFDYTIRFDTISGSNSDKTPIFQSDLLKTKTVTRNEIDYNLYVLKVREGEGQQPKFADSTFQNYKGKLLNGLTFENASNPVWFDLEGFIDTQIGNNGQLTYFKSGGYIPGFVEGITEFKGASGFNVNDDNTVKFTNDFGIGAIFLPSGLGFFSGARGVIPAYSPLIFSFQLFGANQTDHDGDGIPSYLEDLNGDMNVFNDNTDGDNLPNNSDADDDGDGTPTRDEITINEDGTITFTDKNNDGTPDYLDPETYF